MSSSLSQTVALALVLSSLLFSISTAIGGASAAHSGMEEYLPVGMGQVFYGSMAADMGKLAEAKGEPFKICKTCKCCPGGSPNDPKCGDMSCCFKINCNLPNQPFGKCAFQPFACTCDNCS